MGSLEHKTLFNVHLSRQIGREPYVTITAYVYDQEGKLVISSDFINSIKPTVEQSYEVLLGNVVIPEFVEGTYDVKLELSDAYSNVVRIIPEIADPAYDNLFNYPEVFLGGSYDDWTRGKDYELDLSISTNYSLDKISKFNYYTAGNCWDHTIYYKNRKVSESAKMLRVTQSTGGPYAGTKVSVYVDSLDTEPIATWTVNDTGWAAVTKYIELNRILAPGEYTFIFKNEGPNLCCSLFNFAFVNSQWQMDSEQQ